MQAMAALHAQGIQLSKGLSHVLSDWRPQWHPLKNAWGCFWATPSACIRTLQSQWHPFSFGSACLALGTHCAGRAWHSASRRPPWAGQGWPWAFRAAAGGSGSGPAPWSRTRRPRPIIRVQGFGEHSDRCHSRGPPATATALITGMQRPRATRRSCRGERHVNTCRRRALPNKLLLLDPKPAPEHTPMHLLQECTTAAGGQCRAAGGAAAAGQDAAGGAGLCHRACQPQQQQQRAGPVFARAAAGGGAPSP